MNAFLKNDDALAFQLPYFQIAKIKQFQPDQLDILKAQHKNLWNRWKALTLDVGKQFDIFAPSYTESWTNGWQLRAHFFSYFKMLGYEDSAAILSLLLNRKRLTVSLDWHSYRAANSNTTLTQYNQWINELSAKYNDFEIWRGDADEYDDYECVKNFKFSSDADFYCIGKHLNAKDWKNTNISAWIVNILHDLLPLYQKTQ